MRCNPETSFHELHNAETLDIAMFQRFKCMSALVQGYFHRFFIFFSRVFPYISLYILLLLLLFYFTLKRRIHYTSIHKVIENAYISRTLDNVEGTPNRVPIYTLRRLIALDTPTCAEMAIGSN